MMRWWTAVILSGYFVVAWMGVLISEQLHQLHGQTPTPLAVVVRNTDGSTIFLKPTGGIIADVGRGLLRTANNAGLRGAPGQIWMVNPNGDGMAYNLDQQFMSLRPDPMHSGQLILTGSVSYDPNAFAFVPDPTHPGDTMVTVKFPSTPLYVPTTHRGVFMHQPDNTWQCFAVVFNIPLPNVEVLVSVYRNGLLQDDPMDYTFNYDLATATITITPVATWAPGDVVRGVWVY